MKRVLEKKLLPLCSLELVERQSWGGIITAAELGMFGELRLPTPGWA